MAKIKGNKTNIMIEILRSYYGRPDTIFLVELVVSAGQREQRLDSWTMSLNPRLSYFSTGFEIKASRSDLMAELNKPTKRLQGVRLCNQFYFVTPPGLFRGDPVPAECGLIECDFDAFEMTHVVTAPYYANPEITLGFMASVIKRVKES